MYKSVFLLLIGVLLFSSCCTENNSESSTPKVIHDTITVTKTIVDTVVEDQQRFKINESSSYYIRERLPEWFIESQLLDELTILRQYTFDNRLNPLYLEDDFNGDGYLDIAFPILNKSNQKKGFAIIHGHTKQVFILGAGKKIKNGLIDSDDLDYVDVWKINRKRTNLPGLGENPEGIPKKLILDTPSLEIKKTEVGGGLLYWNGSEYAYFHQTC